MGSGTGSTLIINPKGLSSLTMGLTGGEPAAGTTDYIVPLQTLDFNEERRWQAVYGQDTGEGGEVVGESGPLVPITFEVIIKHTTRAGMIDAYDDLQEALLNPKGGTIKYKPEDVGASVLDTYYHYVKSSPPRLIDKAGNRWDAPARDGMYRLRVDVEFLTQPIATSDPDSPVTLSEVTGTLENWIDDSPAQANYVGISASNLKGSMPALVRIMARPGSGQYLGRLIVYRRSEGTLANFLSVYEAEDASQIYPAVGWNSVADSARGDGNYMRCTPATEDNGIEQGLRFTISNPSDHKGRFAVFGVGYDDAASVGVWTHQVKLRVGNVVQEGRSDYEARSLRSWQLIYAGEFELPATPLSDVESAYDTGPYIEWYSSRASGSKEFRLDGIILVYVADSELQPSALDVMCEDGGGVANSEKLLIENLLNDYGRIQEIAHVVAQSDEDFKRALSIAPRGDFLMLDPTKDHRLVFVQEQYLAGTILDDDFESYEGHRWMPIADCETDWDTMSDVSRSGDFNVEGSYGFDHLASGYASDAVDLDLEADGRFDDGDFCCWALYFESAAPSSGSFVLFYQTSAGNNYYNYVAHGDLERWQNFKSQKKSDALSNGSPDWSDITLLSLMDDTDEYCTCDYVRLEKADPDNSDVPNATGAQWDFQPNANVWTITKDAAADGGATLACLSDSGAEKVALIDEITPADVKFRARVSAGQSTDGHVGLVLRAGDDTLTEGAEDCYAVLIGTSGDLLSFIELTNGSASTLDSESFTSAPDTWYTVGVIAKGSQFKVYATATANLTDDDDVFSDSYLIMTVTDASYTSGKCGVMCYTAPGRFDDVKLVSLQDRVVPADDITVEGKAIWRTIAPFHTN
jgi:hypothetical protein